MRIPNYFERGPARVERLETVVIGAGQAGLAVGHQLAMQDVDALVLSDEIRLGDNWRRRWGSLRLQTPARYSGLPGMPFPAPPDHLADKDEVGDYLEQYAARLEIPTRLNTRVQNLSATSTGFRVLANDGATAFDCENVVVATGPFQKPRIPAVAARLATTIHQLHSSQYTNPFDLPDGPVLVVGAGNSGAQIALELARYRKVWLAGPNTGHLPRRLLGRDIFDWIWPAMHFAHLDRRLGRLTKARVQQGGDSLIGLAEQRLAQSGVTRVDRLHDERGGMPLCGAAVVAPRVIIWCTGFDYDYSWIDLPAFEADGTPQHRRGVSTTVPGLYFIGLRFQHRMSSSLIGGVGADAEFIADAVVRRSHARLRE